MKKICITCRNIFNIKPAIVRRGFGKYCSQKCYIQKGKVLFTFSVSFPPFQFQWLEPEWTLLIFNLVAILCFFPCRHGWGFPFLAKLILYLVFSESTFPFCI